MNSYARNIASRVASGELQIIDEFKGEFTWLSNFYQHYSMEQTVEHLFQAGKVYDQPRLQHEILLAKTPGKAKELGRKVDLPADWDQSRRDNVMERAVMWKFDRPGLREWLLATGEIPLIEGNYWHDNYWGDCFCSRCKDIVGVNKLGLTLMKVRSKLRRWSNESRDISSADGRGA